MQIFHRKLLQLHRDKAAKNFSRYDFLYRQVGTEIIERINESTAKNFSQTLLLGYGGQELQIALSSVSTNLVITDISHKMLLMTTSSCTRCPEPHSGVGTQLINIDKPGLLRHWRGSQRRSLSFLQYPNLNTESKNVHILQADEEMLPFPRGYFDLVASNLNLHFVNDLPGTLIQINNILKPGGMLIASLIGGDSLTELRKSLIEAESALGLNISPHIAPMLDARDGASLLQRANFFMPVSDSFTITVLYPTLYKLMQDLKGMGQSNCMTTIPNLTKALLAKTEEIYFNKYSQNGKLTASFEIVMLYGMKNGGQ